MVVFSFTFALSLACIGDPPVADRALARVSNPARPVWMFRYGPSGWTRDPEPIAHSMSSLGLGQMANRLVLTTQCFWKDCGSIFWMHRVGPPVHAIATTDLEHWSPLMWRLVDPEERIPIDTELRQDGREIWYYGTPRGEEGDPALRVDPHTIYRATIAGERVVDPTPMITGPQLADPAPIRLGGETLLWLTTRPGQAVGLARGEPLAIVREWPGISVPHASRVGEEIWVWAHRIDRGRHVPVLSRSTDGETWSPFTAVLDMNGLDGCANPVGAQFLGTPLVFCVQEPLTPSPSIPGSSG